MYRDYKRQRELLQIQSSTRRHCGSHGNHEATAKDSHFHSDCHFSPSWLVDNELASK